MQCFEGIIRSGLSYCNLNLINVYLQTRTLEDLDVVRVMLGQVAYLVWAGHRTEAGAKISLSPASRLDQTDLIQLQPQVTRQEL
jgi:hypothetical protein